MGLVLAVILLGLKPKGEKTKAKINKWDDIQLTRCIAKETIKEVSRQPMGRGEIPINHVSGKGLIYEELRQLNREKNTEVI